MYRCDLLVQSLVAEDDNSTVFDYAKALTVENEVMMAAKSWDEVKAKQTISKS